MPVPGEADVQANLRYIVRQMRLANVRAAHVAHFPQGALSGYVGSDFETFEDFDWHAVGQAIDRVLDLAGELGIWVVRDQLTG